MNQQDGASAKKRLKAIARLAMVERGLLPEFSPAVVVETNRIERAADAADPAIRDLRRLLWASIDNDDSRDLDQLTVAESLAGGNVKILVAVADVDATVEAGSAIDDHARTNTTSVYTAAGIFPMLPEKLSTDLTSLSEGEERLAIIIEMTVKPNGEIDDSNVYRGHVLNHAKLAYNSVAAWLDGNTPAPPKVSAVAGLEAQLRLQDQVAQTLKQRRHQCGSLSLETIEARAVFDGDVISDLRADEKNRAKELIEDFMVAANTVSARFLEQKHFPSVRRLLRPPERWDRIVELATKVGETLPLKPDALALEAFLQRRRAADPERFADLSLSVVKLLGRGEYMLDLPGQEATGHFGLAVRDYSHSTAPNRRFPDLITQRLLKAALQGQRVPYLDEQLAELALHCTTQEDAAAKVERQVRKSAAALLLEGRIGERFNAIVTGASPKGTWVRITHPAAEGRVVHGQAGLDVGDQTRVELIHTDVERGFIDFAHVRVG